MRTLIAFKLTQTSVIAIRLCIFTLISRTFKKRINKLLQKTGLFVQLKDWTPRGIHQLSRVNFNLPRLVVRKSQPRGSRTYTDNFYSPFSPAKYWRQGSVSLDRSTLDLASRFIPLTAAVMFPTGAFPVATRIWSAIESFSWPETPANGASAFFAEPDGYRM